MPKPVTPHKLPYPWKWCRHSMYPPIYCFSCEAICSVQTVEFKGDHYHPACALEIAIGIIESGGFVNAKVGRKYGAKI